MHDKAHRSGGTSKSGFAARKGAVALLNGVLKDHMQLSDLTRADGPLMALVSDDKARAQRLALTTLRHLGRADALLATYVEKLPPMQVLNVLRLAVTELLVEGEAAHGVVDVSVSLIRAQRQSRKMAGMANAVLRRIAAEGHDAWKSLPVPSLPGWLRRRIVHIYDEATVQQIEAAHLKGAPLDLTPKIATQAGEIAEALGGKVMPTGSIRLTQSGQVSALLGYDSGDWWVQDAGAAVAVTLLDPQPGEQILDLCAAPGGKTMQLAASGAQVTALDISGPRMGRIKENLTRTGLEATCVVADALHWDAPHSFDAILLDAPCSATGTIRRHPDLPFAKNGKELHALFELQAAMIDRAVALLKPGGRLVFCTCSLLTEEGERQAKTAIERHGLEEVKPDFAQLGVPQDWAREAGGLRLRPDYWAECGGIDGFFMISLRKPG
ncbi:MAG: RsmB/NOP family class I SAM-dependent RNA methyltransferase [Litoreibacter sp.]|nr:RsmB/NOP family class I SAM-dependent RNA methyltransferase [Litoreibacter sp.]MCY4335901.1 RsmB/NOP family class I SAM-dependent RNA methyltransferase [Litoreibacter sp.]